MEQLFEKFRKRIKQFNDSCKEDFGVVYVASVLVVCVFVSYVGNFFSWPSSSQEVWGQFGDYVGGVLNPILSFLALMAVVKGLRYQSIGVEQARDDAAQARKDAKSAIAMQAEQTNIFKQQSFESLFFALLELHSKSIEGLRMSDENGVDITGHDVLRHVADKFTLDDIQYLEGPPLAPRDRDFAIHNQVKRFMAYIKDDAFECFRCLEQVLDYVDSCPLEDEALKKRYVLIVRAALSSAELECARIYALSTEGMKLKLLQELLIKPKPELYRG